MVTYTLAAKAVCTAMTMVRNTRIHILIATTTRITYIPTVMATTVVILSTTNTSMNTLYTNMSIIRTTLTTTGTIMISRINVVALQAQSMITASQEDQLSEA